MNVRAKLYNESNLEYERRLESAQKQSKAAAELREYMRAKMAATLEKMSANIRVVEDESPAPAPVCPTCGGLGVVRYDVPLGHERFGKLYPCPEQECQARAAAAERRADALLVNSGVPGTYRELTFQTFVDLPADFRTGKELAAGAAYLWSQKLLVSVRAAAELYERPDAAKYSDVWKPWLVLQGDLGLGKTGLAAAATNALAAAGRQPVFYRLQEMFGAIQAHYGENETGRNADEIISQIQRAPALILDECNIDRVSSDKARLFEEIIRYRHARQLPTLLTLNATQDEFEKAWGRRAADVTFSSAHWISLTGKRLRVTDTAIRGF